MAIIEVTLHVEQNATVQVEADPGASDAELTHLALMRLDETGGAEWETHTAWLDRGRP
jgi:hypothetical protein